MSLRGKSEYHFTIQNTQEAEQKIKAWLAANSFQLVQENGEAFYRHGDGMEGYRFFEYTISGPDVTIYPYLGSHKKPRVLTDGLVGALETAPYKHILEPLLAELGRSVEGNNQVQAQQTNIPNQPAAQNQQPAMSAPTTQPIPQNSFNDFKEKEEKNNKLFAEISFWVSIAMILVSFLGVAPTLLLIVINLFLAVQGLKSAKRKKAIVGIILSIVAIVILIVRFVTENF